MSDIFTGLDALSSILTESDGKEGTIISSHGAYFKVAYGDKLHQHEKKSLRDIINEANEPVAPENGMTGKFSLTENGLKFVVAGKNQQLHEEAEVISEISKKTLGSYIKGASYDYKGLKRGDGGPNGSDRIHNQKRRDGIAKAVDKLTGTAKVNAKESLETPHVGTFVEKYATALQSIDEQAFMDECRMAVMVEQSSGGKDSWRAKACMFESQRRGVDIFEAAKKTVGSV